MKKVLNFITIISFFVGGCSTGRQVSQADNNYYEDNYNNTGVTYQNNTDVSYQTFYDQLQPYGDWVNYPEYGNVWQPNVREGFRPYETGGHWVSTVDGWAWASDYNWGWAPFHYGRWLYDQSIGWAWVPGYKWAPAWVTWGQQDQYYAWAPLAPGINVSIGNTWRAPSSYWSFVPRNYINYPDVNRYVVRNSSNTNVNNITIINNYNSYNQRDYYHRGPVYQEVERFTHKLITPLGIVSTKKPGLSRVVKKEFEVYRPSMSGNSANINGAPRRLKLSNETRPNTGAVNGTLQNEAGINRQNQNINKVPIRNQRGVIANGINTEGSVTPENIENTNRQLQQQQMENRRRIRTQIPSDNRPLMSGSPVRTQQFPEINQQNNQQNNARRQVIRSNPPADNIPLSRPQPPFHSERNIQRPASPLQSERIMRQPQAPTIPSRVQSREANPARSMQTGRPGNFNRP